MVVAVILLGALCGLLVGIVVGLGFLYLNQQSDLQSVRRRYFAVHEELQSERRLSREMQASHVGVVERLYEKFTDKQGYVDLVGVLGDKFADVIHGFPGAVPMPTDDTPPDQRNPLMGDIGLDNTAGVQHQRKSWFPEVEDDPWMEPQDRPPERDDEVVAWETNPATMAPAMPNGGGYRRSPAPAGQPLFRSGQSGEPPRSGVE